MKGAVGINALLRKYRHLLFECKAEILSSDKNKILNKFFSLFLSFGWFTKEAEPQLLL